MQGAYLGKTHHGDAVLDTAKAGILRRQSIRVDSDAVTFLWSGGETGYSGMISDHKGYSPMLNAIMDDLADIADAILDAR